MTSSNRDGSLVATKNKGDEECSYCLGMIFDNCILCDDDEG